MYEVERKIYYEKPAEPKNITGLLTVTLQVIRNDRCAIMYEDNFDIISSQLCAYDNEGRGRDAWCVMF